MSIEAARLMVIIGADVDQAERALRSIGGQLRTVGEDGSASLRGLGSASTDTNSRLLGFVSSAGASMVGFLGSDLVAAAGRAAGAMFDLGITYQSNLNVFQAVSGATAAQMDKVRATAKALGADLSLPATSAADAAAGMTELARAGLSVQDSLSAAKGVMQLAAAASTDEATAATITATALNAFTLKGTEATRVADLLAGAANASAAEITDMGDALRMSSTVSAQAGQKVEDVTAALAEMANKSLIGQDAGTSLKQMLLSLMAPSKSAASLMSELGVNVYDTAGRMLPLRDIVDRFSGALSGLTKQQQDQTLATIFGSDAIRAAGIVLAGGTEQFDRMKDAVTRTGAASDIAGARMKGLGGALQGLQSQAETLALDFYDRVSPALEDATRWLAESLPAAAGKAGDTLAGIWDAAGPTIIDLGRVVGELGLFVAHTAEAAAPLVEALLAVGGGAVVGVLQGVADVLGPIAGFFADNETAAKAFAVALTAIAVSKGVTALATLGSGLLDRVAIGMYSAAGGATQLQRSLSLTNAAVAGLTLGVTVGLDQLQRGEKQAQRFVNAWETDRPIKNLSDLTAEINHFVGVYDDAQKRSSDNWWDRGVNLLRSFNWLGAKDAAKASDAEGQRRWLEGFLGGLTRTYTDYNSQLEMVMGATGMSQANIEKSIQRLGISVDAFANVNGESAKAVIADWNAAAGQVNAATGLTINANGKSAESMKQLAKEAEQFREAMASSFNSATSIVAALGDQTVVTKEQVLAFFQKSVEDARNWSENLIALSKTGIEYGLLEELALAGPKAAGLVKGLLDTVNAGGKDAINQSRTDAQQILTDLQNAILARRPGFAEAGSSVGQGFAGGLANELSAASGGLVGFVDGMLAEMSRARGFADQLLATPPSGGPRARPFAHGGIVTSPTFSLLGEGNRREVVLPLTNPARTRELAAVSGLYDTLGIGRAPGAPAASVGGSPVSVNIDASNSYFLDREAPARLVAAIREGLERDNGFRASKDFTPVL